jgi:putative glutamine amidotransferase
MNYIEAVRSAAAIPVVLAAINREHIEDLLSRIQGLVLSGGPDLHPRAYGQNPHALLGEVEVEIDEFEINLCVAARHRQIPVLGICRGLQVINVAAGGSLHQHLPDLIEGREHHRRSEAAESIHGLEIVPKTKLAEIMGASSLTVNSSHHQAVDVLGDGLVVSARAEDGVIEAIEGIGDQWLVGVQWHAESLIADARELAIFQALAHAASGA